MLDWMSRPAKPNIVWLVTLQLDKPNLVLAWLDNLINPNKGWLDYVCALVWICVILLFPSSLWKSCLAQGW